MHTKFGERKYESFPIKNLVAIFYEICYINRNYFIQYVALYL